MNVQIDLSLHNGLVERRDIVDCDTASLLGNSLDLFVGKDIANDKAIVVCWLLRWKEFNNKWTGFSSGTTVQVSFGDTLNVRQAQFELEGIQIGLELDVELSTGGGVVDRRGDFLSATSHDGELVDETSGGDEREGKEGEGLEELHCFFRRELEA